MYAPDYNTIKLEQRERLERAAHNRLADEAAAARRGRRVSLRRRFEWLRVVRPAVAG